ncbi:MAG: Fe-S cluster assembly protein SufD, partial [Gammaproteobacteria bacterium]|nr:Fe-S cluster assembly protein SufD [Gammaproteobacteria bacterium]
QAQALVDHICDAIDANWLVIANGHIDAQILRGFTQACEAGTLINRLSDAEVAFSFDAPLSDLNAALLQDGLRIHVAEDAAISRPLGLLFVDNADAAPGMTQTRVELELGAGSAATFIEYHASSGSGDHYSNAVNSLVIGDNAHAKYVRVQDRSLRHKHTNRLAVSCGRNSRFNHCGFDIGGGFVRNDVVIDIAKPGSRVEFDGLYLAGDGQHIDNHTRTDHRVGPAESHQEYRGILSGQSRAVWNGKTIVHVGADGTDAEQSNHNLLLSEKSEIDAKPELEIYADDVKCSHGTTVGQLDETALFYLRSRGIDKHNARQILTTAFANTIVGKSPIHGEHDPVGARVAQRLDEMMHGASA